MMMKYISAFASLAFLLPTATLPVASALVQKSHPTSSGVIGGWNRVNPAPMSLAPPMAPALHSSISTVDEQDDSRRALLVEQRRQDWIEKSVTYYGKVMRARVEDGTLYHDESIVLAAQNHYFALRKIKEGRLDIAEVIYRRVIDELMLDEDQCDHSKFAVATLLLALLTQRMGDAKKTRSVFLNFFKLAVLEREEGTKCACSAKVLQAYALFEMKQGNSLKSLQIVKRALQFDKTLAPVLNWAQFREVLQRDMNRANGANSA